MTIESWQRRPGLLPRLRWTMALPLRSIATSRRQPTGRGLASRAARRAAHLCGRVASYIAWPTVQPGSVVVMRTPAGVRLSLAADSVLAWIVWFWRAFERPELIMAGQLAVPGSYAVDVGANVGVYSVDLSRAVGPTGRVIAIEPIAATTEQLRSNLVQSGCHNVEVVVAAAGAVSGEIELLLAADSALHTASREMDLGRLARGSMQVPCVTLDELWHGAGRPPVSFVKIDVEGGEEGVLRGALELIAACRPSMIVEVHRPAKVGELIELLPDYEAVSPPGFTSWNYLFRSARPPESVREAARTTSPLGPAPRRS